MKLLRKITAKDFGRTNETSYENSRNAVRAVLLDENDYMALMYLPKFQFNNYADLYMIPGGGVEANENIEKALEREMLEETGCHINIIEELGYIECPEDKFAAITYYYLAKVAGEKGQTQMMEHEKKDQTELQWHSLEKALDIIDNETANGLVQYIKFRDKTALSEAIKYLRK